MCKSKELSSFVVIRPLYQYTHVDATSREDAIRVACEEGEWEVCVEQPEAKEWEVQEL